MLHKTFLAILTMATITSCQQIDTDELSTTSTESTEAKTRSVQFVCKGIDVDYSTRATLATEKMTDLFVWEGTTLLAHQTSTDTDFGSPTIALTIGAHDLTFVASKASSQNWADGVWTCTKVSDTYGTVLSYTVSNSSTSKQVQLTRVNGKVLWTVEDEIPSSVTKVSISVPQCYGLDASLNGVNAGTYQVNDYSIATHTAWSIYTMVIPANHTDGSTISPTITFNDGTTYTTSCTVKPNIVTNIHGTFFNGSSNAAVSLSTEWGDTTNVSIR